MIIRFTEEEVVNICIAQAKLMLSNAPKNYSAEFPRSYAGDVEVTVSDPEDALPEIPVLEPLTCKCVELTAPELLTQ